MSRNKNNRFIEFLAGKGFYIILILCVAAIGVSGYMLFFSGGGGDGALDYLDDSLNNVLNADQTSLDRITMPTLPGTSPNMGNALTLEDIPVAAITEIPSPTPKVSPTPADSPAAAVSPPASPNPSPTKTNPPSKIPGVFVWPVKGAALNAFSAEDLVYNKTMGDWRVHMGMDIECAMGTQVAAVADGTVKDIYDDVFLGTTVVIEHSGGLVSYYSNLLKKPTVSISEKVKAGQVIGGVGQTAEGERREVNHLHLEMQLNNVPVDPADYLPKE